MKKTYFLLFLLFGLIGLGSAQTVIFSSDFETWSGNYPDGWGGAKNQIEADSCLPYTTSVHGGVQACQLINKEATHRRFTTTPLAVTNGETYIVTFWVRGHGRIRTSMFDERPTGSGYATYNAYIDVNSTTWTEQSQTIVCANSSAIGEFIISTQLTFADLDNLQIDDVTVSTLSGGGPMLSITAPTNNGTVYTASPTISFLSSNFVIGNPGTGIDGHIHYTVDGGAAVMYYTTAPIPLSGLTDGAHQVILQLVDNSHTALNPPVADTVNFTVNTAGPSVTSIYDIQYTTDPAGNSPLMDQTVTTAGVVTGFHASGYFLQSGFGQWNGIYVYDNQHPVTVGDSVIVSGTVKEYFNLTEIGSVTNFVLATSGNALPAPVVINCQSLNSEPFEGVLSKVMNVQCVNPNAGFGMWKIEDASDTAKVHNLLFAYTPVLNTYYNITGPIHYTFNEYRIEPRNAADVQVVTGINDPENNSQVSIYPNPVLDILNIKSDKVMSNVNVYDVIGKTVFTALVNNSIYSIQTEKFVAGTYLLEMVYTDGKIYSTRFVK